MEEVTRPDEVVCRGLSGLGGLAVGRPEKEDSGEGGHQGCKISILVTLDIEELGQGISAEGRHS